jgi:hypothetical protein
MGISVSERHTASMLETAFQQKKERDDRSCATHLSLLRQKVSDSPYEGSTSETSALSYQTTRCHKTQHNNIDIDRCESLDP